MGKFVSNCKTIFLFESIHMCGGGEVAILAEMENILMSVIVYIFVPVMY